MTQEHALVSVIILNYNGAEFLEKCVESVLRTNYPCFEVILVDNASTDGSLKSIIKHFGNNPRLRVLRNDANVGFAEGNNIGLKHAKGSIISLLNNDTEVERNWLEEAVETAESDKEAGIVQSKIFFSFDRDTLESAGAFIDRCGYGFERGFVKNKMLYNNGDEVFYANGAAVTIKRSALEKVSYVSNGRIFDPDFFFGYEDVDLCWQMRLAGYKTIVAANSVVYHQRSRTTSRRLGKLVFHHCKNRIMTLVKNYSLKNLMRYLPLLIILEFDRALLHLVKRRAEGTLAIFKALAWNIENFKSTWRKRLTVQHLIRQVPDDSVTKLMRNVIPASLIHNLRLYEKFSAETGVDIIR